MTVCDMTQFICVTWCISYKWHDTIHICDMTQFIVTRLIHVCDLTESCHTYELSQFTYMNWVMSHVRNESCHIYKLSHVTCKKWVMSYICIESYVVGTGGWLHATYIRIGTDSHIWIEFICVTLVCGTWLILMSHIGIAVSHTGVTHLNWCDTWLDLYVWHDLSDLCVKTHPYMWHHSIFTRDMTHFMYVPWLNACMCHDSMIHVTILNPYVWHDSIHTCDMTHPYMWQDSFIHGRRWYVIWLNSYTWYDSILVFDMTQFVQGGEDA